MNKEKINVILGAFLLSNIPEIITQEEFDDVKSAIKELQKKAELTDHYKHLYSDVKKQKDDVVEYLKERITYDSSCNMEVETYISPKNLLRMLGEIDETDNLQ